MHNQRPLLQMSEEDLIWISGFADALRQLSPELAADDNGLAADGFAREAFEAQWLRSLPAAHAARNWWRNHTYNQR